MATTVDRRGTTATTADAGAVSIALPAGAAFPAGSIAVNSSDAGSVCSGAVAGVRSTGSGAAASRGGFTVTTIRSGSVAADGPVRCVDTSRAGSVKISFAATTQEGSNGQEGAQISRMAAATAATAQEGSNVKEGAQISRMVAATAATALDLLDVVHSTADGDKLRAFLAFVGGAAKMHARGPIGGSIILFAGLAGLLVSVAVKRGAWI